MFSIIIPVYNAARYLGKCIDSVLTQSYTDFELLLIDDGSTDGSAEICDSYTNVKNVSIYHQLNLGVSAARNFGIEHAKGQWILFIDSDDYVDQDYLAHCTLATAGESSECSVIFPTFINKPHIDCMTIVDNLYTDDYECEVKEIIEKTNCFTSKSASVYSKLYNTQLLHEKGVRFLQHTSINEDSMFNTEYFRDVGKVKYINRPFYHYMIHQDTISLTRNSIRPYKSYYNSCLEMMIIYSQTMSRFSIDIRLKEFILQKISTIMFRGYRSILLEECCYKERKSRLVKYNAAFKPYCKYMKDIKSRLFLILIYSSISYRVKILFLSLFK